MDFNFNEEQSLIQGQVSQFIQRDYDWEKRQELSNSERGFSDENWKQFAELGWLGISISEEAGGFGGSSLDTMIIMEEFGKGLVVEPFLETIVLSASILDDAGSKQQKDEILNKVIEGNLQLATAFSEPQSRYNLEDIVTTATKQDDSYLINGFKSVVMNGPAADSFIISVRTSGSQSDKEGITLFLLDSNQNGVSKRDYATVDGRKACELTLEDVSVSSASIIGKEGGGLDLLQNAINRAILAVSAEAVVAMEVIYKTTVEYTKTREQFGQAIGKFQVLQHRMVDMFMEYEQAKSLLYMATIKHSEGAKDADKAIAGLKYHIGKAGKFIGQQSVQLHGGMGVTEELNVGHYFKRLTTIGTIFGNSDYHLVKYSKL